MVREEKGLSKKAGSATGLADSEMGFQLGQGMMEDDVRQTKLLSRKMLICVVSF